MAKRSAKQKHDYVHVIFLELHEPMPDRIGKTYLYRWTLKSKPKIGTRVMVPGLSDDSPAVVVSKGKRSDYRGAVADVDRLPTYSETLRARMKANLKFW